MRGIQTPRHELRGDANMSEEFRPIQVIRLREMDTVSVEDCKPKDGPHRMLSGAELVRHAQQIASSLLSCCMDEPHNERLPYVLEVTLNEWGTAQSKRAAIIDLFENDGADGPRHILGMRGSRCLILRVQGKAQIEALVGRIEGYDLYARALSCISRIDRFRPEVEIVEGEDLYKARLLDFQEANPIARAIFENQLETLEITFEKTRYARDLLIYRMHADANQAKAVVEGVACETLFSMSPMPRAT